MANEYRCGLCIFWEKDSQQMDRGECHRNAPFFHPIEQVYEFSGRNPLEGLWPQTDETDWCGEFRPRSTLE